MRLRKAIQRAANFAVPDKQEDGRGLSGIRLIPAYWGEPGEGTQITALKVADLPELSPSSIKGQVEKAIKDTGHEGLTCEEVETLLGITHQTASPRVGELYEAGYILDSGKERLTCSGKLATVFVSSLIHVDTVLKIPIPKRPPIVWATDGTVGCLIYVDPGEDVPDCVINASAAKKAVTALKQTPFQLTQTGPSSMLIKAATGEEFLVGGHQTQGFPAPPSLPSLLRTVVDFDLVRRVVHAVGDDEDRPELNMVHFAREFVEATDQVRASRVMLSGLVPKGGLVPSKVFQKWPRSSKLGVGLAVEHGNIYFHVDGELRFTGIQDDQSYFDLSPFFSDREAGSQVGAATELLKQKVKHAASASARDFVRLTFSPEKMKVVVVGLGEDDGQTTFIDEVPAEFVSYSDKKANTSLVVKGRSLWAALDAVPDPTVDLRYTTSERPLRILAPFFTEAIWPLIKVEVPQPPAPKGS